MSLPAGVQVELKDGLSSVKGQKGALQRPFLGGLEMDMTDGTITVRRLSDDKRSRSYHGLMRTLVANMVEGVSKGFEKKLEIVGIGYRSELKGSDLALFLGYSHPINFPLPAGISAEVEKQTLRHDQGDRQRACGPDGRQDKGPAEAGSV